MIAISKLHEVFESFSEDYLKFELYTDPPHDRPDIAAFILLSKLVPEPGHSIIAAAEHDEIWLSTDVEKLANVATEEDIRNLRRCGVRYDRSVHSLALFI